MTQCEAIVDYIKEHGSITSKDAMNDLYIYRLASRISDLKRAGYPIETTHENVKTPYGKATIARYRLG